MPEEASLSSEWEHERQGHANLGQQKKQNNRPTNNNNNNNNVRRPALPWDDKFSFLLPSRKFNQPALMVMATSVRLLGHPEQMMVDFPPGKKFIPMIDSR